MSSQWNKCNKHHIIVEDMHCPECEDEKELTQKLKDYETALEFYGQDGYGFSVNCTELIGDGPLSGWVTCDDGEVAREVLNKYRKD